MESLFKFYKFVDQIQRSTSRNYKLEILKYYKDDADIKYYLEYVYNPYKVTGLSSKKLYKDVPNTTNSEIQSLKDLLEYILVNNTGRDELIGTIHFYKQTYIPEELWDLFDKIVTKTLSIGVDVISINKCMGNLIPTFNVQLANKYFERPEYVQGKQFALTTKIDGGRIIAMKENGKVTFYTRQGQLYEGLVDLEKEMSEKLPDNICLDGEIMLLNTEGLISKEQYKATMKITRKDGEKHGVKMLVFDCMTAEEFRNQKCSTLYMARRNNMLNKFCELIPDCAISTKVALGVEPKDHYNAIINFLNTKYTYFQILPYLYIGEDTAKITELLNENIAKGEEGIMINILDAPYQFKRTSDLLKCKVMQDIDLEVIGYEEGDKNFTGMLGALLVRYKDGNVVKVGSGFSKKLRQEIWKDPDSYVGKIAVIQYFEETENQNGGISLRFPVFLEFRDPKDKNTPDF